MTIEVSLGGGKCNPSVNTTAQCSMDIELGNISKQIATTEFSDSDLPSTTAAPICMNPTSTVKFLTTITTTVESTQMVTNSTTVTSTITRTQTVNALTTVSVSICPITLYEASHLLTSSYPSCTPSTVTTTIIYKQQPPTVLPVLSNMIPSCPACRVSTVTTTIYQQSSVVLSNEVGIVILTASVVVICLPVLTLVIVTYCWIRTRRILKKKRCDPEMKFVYLAQDR